VCTRLLCFGRHVSSCCSTETWQRPFVTAAWVCGGSPRQQDGGRTDRRGAAAHCPPLRHWSPLLFPHAFPLRTPPLSRRTSGPWRNLQQTSSATPEFLLSAVARAVGRSSKDERRPCGRQLSHDVQHDRVHVVWHLNGSERPNRRAAPQAGQGKSGRGKSAWRRHHQATYSDGGAASATGSGGWSPPPASPLGYGRHRPQQPASSPQRSSGRGLTMPITLWVS